MANQQRLELFPRNTTELPTSLTQTGAQFMAITTFFRSSAVLAEEEEQVFRVVEAEAEARF
jgi:hypothetical protein